MLAMEVFIQRVPWERKSSLRKKDARSSRLVFSAQVFQFNASGCVAFPVSSCIIASKMDIRTMRLL